MPSLRQKGLDWLRAELEARRKQAGNRNQHNMVCESLRLAQKDADLASVRDTSSLARLPEKERANWEEFWTNVATLLHNLEPPPVRL